MKHRVGKDSGEQSSLSVWMMRSYRWGRLEARQFHRRIQGFLWPGVAGLLILGALVGGNAGIGIISGFLGFVWFSLLFQNRLVLLPRAGPIVEQAVRRQSRRLGLTAPKVYEFRSSSVGASAMTGIFGKPAIVVDSGVVWLPADELDALLAHELVHIKHRDSFVVAVLATLVAFVEIAVAVSLLDKWAVAMVGVIPLVSWVLEIKADMLGVRACSDPMALSRFLRQAGPYSWLFIFFVPVLTLVLWYGHESFSLRELSLISCFLAASLPTHPLTLLRTWTLKRVYSGGGTARWCLGS